MQKEEKKIIMYDSPEAAEYKTITGWVSSGKGGYPMQWYGENEHMARWAGCTHHKCECGNVMERGWTKCEECRRKAAIERYNAKPFKEWDSKEPVCIWDGDRYFFDLDDLEEYMLENEQWEIDLIICEPVYFSLIGMDRWSDETHEEWEPPESLVKKLNEFNAFLKSLPGHSWKPGKFRTKHQSEEVKAELEKAQQ